MPTNFLWGFFYNAHSETEYDIGDAFKPYRVVVSEGFENPHWVIKENHEYYKPLWNDAKAYIKYLLTDKSVTSKGEYGREFWGDVVLKKSFVFEFKTCINSELLAAFLNESWVSGFKSEGIYKMAILPSENINKNLTIYVFDGDKVNKYVVPFVTKGLSIKDYDDIIANLYKQDIDEYGVIKEYVTNYVYQYLSPDVLIVAQGPKFRNYKNLICEVPQKIRDIQPNSSQDLNDIAKTVLGENEDDYIRSIDVYNNTIVFQNLSSMYRIYKDGLLEYKYLHTINNYEKGSKVEALKRALEFINRRDKLAPGVDIYLSGIVEHSNYYTFTFDYKCNDIAVSFNEYTVNNKDKNKLNHAITVDVNSQRVLSCYWILKEFKLGKDNLMLNVKFESLFDDIFTLYQDISIKDFSVKDINMSYEVKFSINSQSLEPVWIVETIEGKRYVVPMQRKPPEGK
ncbi:hypothetical protein [Acetivibrio straminisolvens]|uniref:hypothetical protein n=1 Tax=Acetivibrio straminisolvens TaxID=253314 RepID=UPI00223EB445|nr:hypothetical protein [Acetivibrio straminisolvens]